MWANKWEMKAEKWYLSLTNSFHRDCLCSSLVCPNLLSWSLGCKGPCAFSSLWGNKVNTKWKGFLVKTKKRERIRGSVCRNKKHMFRIARRTSHFKGTLKHCRFKNQTHGEKAICSQSGCYCLYFYIEETRAVISLNDNDGIFILRWGDVIQKREL